MATEVRNTSAYPYRAIVSLILTYPDGAVEHGTGTLVGRNDILTASHLVYSPQHGGFVTNIRLDFGADFNASIGQYENIPFPYNLDSATWVNYYTDIYSSASTGVLSIFTAQNDVAIIGTHIPWGDLLGTFGMDPKPSSFLTTYAIGYPNDSSGMILGTPNASASIFSDVYAASTDLMTFGSSGGPLFVYENGAPYVIGVKSFGSSTSNTWADIGHTYSSLLANIAGNDYLIDTALRRGSTSSDYLTGTAGSDLIYANAGDDTIDSSFGVDDINGGPGIDTFIYSGRSYFSAISRNPWLSSTAGSDYTLLLYGRGSNDKYLTSVERVQFTDGLYAIDMRAGQAGWETALIVGGVFGKAGLDNYELVGAVLHFLDATAYSMDQTVQVLFDIGVFSTSWSRQTTVNYMHAAIPLTATNSDSTQQAENSFLAGQMTAQSYIAALMQSKENQTNVDIVGLQTFGMHFF